MAPAFAKPDSVAAARIRSEIARSRQVSIRSQERPRLWRGPSGCPGRPGSPARFGTARVFNGEVQSRHLGTDFAGAVGMPVRAAGRGVVALVADFYLAGRAVYIDHGAGLVTGYFHLSRADVREGDTVIAGQRIGAVGRSGRVTGPHLHWVARYGAISVDPMSLLQLEKEKPRVNGSSSKRTLTTEFTVHRYTCRVSQLIPAARPSDPPSPCSASSPDPRRMPSAWPPRCESGRPRRDGRR